jgi:hypothetical protein
MSERPQFNSLEKYEAWVRKQEAVPSTAPSRARCPDCGREIFQGVPVCPDCGTSTGFMFSERPGYDFSGLPAYYREEFAAIESSQEEYKGQWNSAAFLLFPYWGLFHGVWLASLLAVVAGILTLGIGWIAYAFVFGFRGNYLYYSAYAKHKQLPY